MPGYFYTPTLLTNVDPDSEIAQEEVFGPVLVVIAYDDDDDAVRIANNSIYGLSGCGVRRSRTRAGDGPSHPDRNASPSTAATTSAPTARSAATSSPASAARWARRDSRSSSSEDTRQSLRLFAGSVQPMRPLEGIRVLEVAMYGFVPSAGAVLGRVGRRRHQGRARRDRRPAARPAADRPAARRGRSQPEHRARQPRQAQHRAGHVGARGQGGAARRSPAAPTCSSPASCQDTGRSSASMSTTSAP